MWRGTETRRAAAVVLLRATRVGGCVGRRRTLEAPADGTCRRLSRPTGNRAAGPLRQRWPAGASNGRPWPAGRQCSCFYALRPGGSLGASFSAPSFSTPASLLSICLLLCIKSRLRSPATRSRPATAAAVLHLQAPSRHPRLHDMANGELVFYA